MSLPLYVLLDGPPLQPVALLDGAALTLPRRPCRPSLSGTWRGRTQDDWWS